MNIQFHDIIGNAGVAMIVITYFMLQINKISSNSLLYSLLNALGAFLVVVSLMFEFNLSAFIVQAFWCLISLVGIIKYFISKNQMKQVS